MNPPDGFKVPPDSPFYLFYKSMPYYIHNEEYFSNKSIFINFFSESYKKTFIIGEASASRL
jgi:hypothetical protein